MRATTVALDDPARSRTRTQIVWEAQNVANEQRLNELQTEVRELRCELDATRAELAKALSWMERHWIEAHHTKEADHEGQ